MNNHKLIPPGHVLRLSNTAGDNIDLHFGRGGRDARISYIDPSAGVKYLGDVALLQPWPVTVFGWPIAVVSVVDVRKVYSDPRVLPSYSCVIKTFAQLAVVKLETAGGAS